MKNKKNKLYSYIYILLLIIALVYSLYEKNWIITILIIINTVMVYFPILINKFNSKISINKIEILSLTLIYFLIFFSKTTLINLSELWFRIIFYFLFSSILSFIGFTLIYFLNKEKKSVFELSYIFLAFFSFCFSITIGVLWQTLRFSLDYIFQINIQNYNPSDALGFLAINVFSAGLISILGYIYLKTEDDKYFLKRFFKSFFKDKESDILSLIKKGESEFLEFKSTLRTNLHTNEHDKRIEHSALKTICAFLNSSGGILLIGVSDDKKIVGIKKDNFKNKDKLTLHLINLIKQNFSQEYTQNIKFQIFRINKEQIIKFEVLKSNKEVFLKSNLEEEFYIRSGPSSIQLKGSDLIKYVNKRFG
jgi:hypothetical protein